MTLEHAVKPISITVLVLAIIFAVYVYQVSESQSTQSADGGAIKSLSKMASQQALLSAGEAKSTIEKVVKQASTATESNLNTSVSVDGDAVNMTENFAEGEGAFKLSDQQAQATDIRELRPTINVSGNADELYFEPETEMDYKEMKVVISLPNGEQIKQTFNGDEPITIAGKSLEDGGYQWEAQATPKIASSITKEMAAVRARGNFEEEQKLISELRETGYLPSAQQVEANVQTGYFTIKDGAMVMPEDSEKAFIEQGQ